MRGKGGEGRGEVRRGERPGKRRARLLWNVLQHVIFIPVPGMLSYCGPQPAHPLIAALVNIVRLCLTWGLEKDSKCGTLHIYNDCLQDKIGWSKSTVWC